MAAPSAEALSSLSDKSIMRSPARSMLVRGRPARFPRSSYMCTYRITFDGKESLDKTESSELSLQVVQTRVQTHPCIVSNGSQTDTVQ